MRTLQESGVPVVERAFASGDAREIRNVADARAQYFYGMG